MAHHPWLNHRLSTAWDQHVAPWHQWPHRPVQQHPYQRPALKPTASEFMARFIHGEFTAIFVCDICAILVCYDCELVNDPMRWACWWSDAWWLMVNSGWYDWLMVIIMLWVASIMGCCNGWSLFWPASWHQASRGLWDRGMRCSSRFLNVKKMHMLHSDVLILRWPSHLRIWFWDSCC